MPAWAHSEGEVRITLPRRWGHRFQQPGDRACVGYRTQSFPKRLLGSLVLDRKSPTYLKLGHPEVNFRFDNSTLRTKWGTSRKHSAGPDYKSIQHVSVHQPERVCIDASCIMRENGRMISRCAVASRQVAWAAAQRATPLRTPWYCTSSTRGQKCYFCSVTVGSTKHELFRAVAIE
jgi:hypothetical protein